MNQAATETTNQAMSPIVKMSVSAATPVAAMVAMFVLLAGHNRPGGGFAAGLLAGAIVVVRTVAGLSRPPRATPFLAVGGLIVGLTALAPILWGDTVLDQVVIDEDIPILGTLKTGSALVFDIGVVAIVVGLVIAVVDGFNASRAIGPDADEGPDAIPAPAEPRAGGST